MSRELEFAALYGDALADCARASARWAELKRTVNDPEKAQIRYELAEIRATFTTRSQAWVEFLKFLKPSGGAATEGKQ